jgi:predicted transcriptional regulator
MARKTLLISIKPRYAAMIFSGAKTVELRRKEPRVGPGDRMIVYVSSPTMEVTGECTVTEIEKAAPDKLWKRVRDKAGVTKQEFDDYFDGADQAIAIHLRKPKIFETPVGLGALRKALSIHPPQSFRYLQESDWALCT